MDVFCQKRTWRRAWRLGVTQLLCLGRHTLTDLLCTCGRQGVDWSADYRLFSQDRWDPQRLWALLLGQVLSRLPANMPLVLVMDDTVVKKTGTHIPGVSYRRDPLSPKFYCNLIRGQRFLQVSAPLPAAGTQIQELAEGAGTVGVAGVAEVAEVAGIPEIPGIPGVPGVAGAARCIPVAYEHAPSLPRPRKQDSPAQWQAYRQRRKQENLSTRGRDLLQSLRSQMERDPHGQGRSLVVVVDGSFTNQTLLRGLPPQTALIGRVRKDLKLWMLPPASPQTSRRVRYGAAAPTPLQLRQDPQVPWQTVPAFAAGKQHDFQVKTLGPLLWKTAGPSVPLRLVVIAPLGYRLRKHSRLLYRQAAYLICTHPQLPLTQIVQYYLWRWGIEVNHRDEKQIVGVGQAQVTNALAARRQPALAVFSYALLLLAAADTGGVGALQGPLAPPKWRRKDAGPLTTQQMVQQLRKEAWADELDRLADAHDDLVTADPRDTKSSPPGPTLAAAVLCGSAA